MRERDTTVLSNKEREGNFLVARYGELTQGRQPCVKNPGYPSSFASDLGRPVEMDNDPSGYTSRLASLPPCLHINPFHQSLYQNPVLNPPVVPPYRVD